MPVIPIFQAAVAVGETGLMHAGTRLSGEVAVSTMLWVSLCVYLVVGLLLWALGPIHRWVGGEPPLAGRRMAGVPGRGARWPWLAAMVFALLWPLMILAAWLIRRDNRARAQGRASESASDSADEPSRVLPRRELPPGIDPVELEDWLKNNPLYIRPLWFETIGTGCGTLHCESCGYEQRWALYLHGFGKDAWAVMGYQCRQCHCLTDRRWDRDHPEQLRPLCECGGELARSGLIVCPRCAGPDMSTDLLWVVT